MATPKRRQQLVAALRVVVCLGALLLVLRGVDLDDRVELADGTALAGEVRESGGGLVVLSEDGTARPVAYSQLARLDDGTPAIQLGLRTAFRSSRLDLFALAVLLFVPVTFMLGWRFQLVLRAGEIRIGYWAAVKLTFAGSFLSFVPFLLGAYGGDVFKAYFVSLHTERKTEAVTSVFLDRVIGLLGVIVIVTFAAAISPRGIVRVFLWPMLLLLALGAAAAALYLWPALRARLPLHWLDRLPRIDQLRRVDRTARRLAMHKSTVALCLVVTVVRQLAAFASYALVALSLGLSIGVDRLVEVSGYFAAGVAVGAVPISPQGLGTVELAYSIFFREFGTPSQILCLAFGVRLVHMLSTLPGLGVVVAGAYRPPSIESVRSQLPEHPAPD
jgi:uncharacterized membrane protein YbhN (UPF0104 family)